MAFSDLDSGCEEDPMTSIAPWLSVDDAGKAVDYYRAAFGAVELERLEDGAGGVVIARLSIDGADFWVQHEPGASPDGQPVRMILTVEDPDAAFTRALAAGGTEVSPVADGHGWRIGRFADPSGHHWEVGRRLAP